MIGEKDFLTDRYNAYNGIILPPLAPGEKRKRYDWYGLEIDEDTY
jgi:hypothetical protein